MRLVQFLLNLTPVRFGFYYVEGNKIRRTFFNRFSYIAAECKSDTEAQRITKDLNQLSNK